ncbi:MAG TPA: hypothetical protein VFI25_07610 [Planctomycetota bacterium]|jgi:hypothetical protein|nr:hypothetical protein [Planctomycetota bacterium]
MIAPESMIHRETVRWGLGWLFPPIFLLILLAYGKTVAWAAVQGRQLTGEHLAGLAFSLASGGLCAWWLFRNIIVEFGPNGALLGVGLLGRRLPLKRFPLEQIEDAWQAQHRGLGLPGGFWGFVRGPHAFRVIKTRSGIDMRVRTRPGRTGTFFLSCREPQRALQAMGFRA